MMPHSKPKNVISFFLILFTFLAFSSPAFSFWPFSRKASAKPAPAVVATQSAAQSVDQVVAPVVQKEENLTLDAAYQLALKKSEVVGISKEDLEQAQARFYKAFDVILPKVNYQITRAAQDAPEATSGSDSFTGNALRKRTPLDKFTFSQPIFSGFKEIAALTGAGADRKQYQFKLKRAKEMLFINVVESFYALIQSQKDVLVLEKAKDLMSERAKDLRERVDLGRSRESEWQSAISDLRTIEVDLLEAKRDEALARELLSFYVGRKIQEPLDDTQLEIDNLLDVSAYLSTVFLRSDVQAAQNAKTVAYKKVVSAQAGLFPTVTLDGNYYTRRVGFQSGIDWDLLLTVDVPIFDKLNVIGDIKQAASEKDAAVLEYQRVRRSAELEIENNFENLKYSIAIDEKLAQAKEASKKNYELVTEDYAHNLVNNLEVIDVFRHYQDIELRYNQEHYTMKKNYWKFKVAVNQAPLKETKRVQK